VSPHEKFLVYAGLFAGTIYGLVAGMILAASVIC
jgi:tetrahydromethanopterin S-methyltransferase subunit F